MSFWTAAVIIVAIWGLVQIKTARHAGSADAIRDEDGNSVRLLPSDPELRRELEDLRERIKVLERITTDTNTLAARESRAIAAEIEALRDQ